MQKDRFHKSPFVNYFSSFLILTFFIRIRRSFSCCSRGYLQVRWRIYSSCFHLKRVINKMLIFPSNQNRVFIIFKSQTSSFCLQFPKKRRIFSPFCKSRREVLFEKHLIIRIAECFWEAGEKIFLFNLLRKFCLCGAFFT